MDIPKTVVDRFMKFWYWYINRRDKNSEITFLNYGFSNHDKLDLEEKDEFNRYPIQLYNYITSYQNIEGLEILEVGSGRGGGAGYITRRYKPKSYIGIDLNKRSIEFCNRYYLHKDLSFTHGDALNIPFENNKFDVVINIESSHRYTNMDKFLIEVHRVLKKKGFFFFADFRDNYLVDRLHSQFNNSNMEIIKMEIITRWIVKALELDHERKKNLIKYYSPLIFRPIAKDFSALKGSKTYRWFDIGRLEYLYYTMQK